MIIKFKLFEIEHNQTGGFRPYRFNGIEIGDYVITSDSYNLSVGDKPALWHNMYGVILDFGYFIHDKSKTPKLSLIHFLCELSEKDKIHIKDQHSRASNIIGVEKRYDSHDEYDTWFHNDYLINYKSKKEFEDAIEEIEMKKNAKKYNL